MERLKHWQIFGLFCLPFFVSMHLKDELYKDLLIVTSFLIVTFYLMGVGTYLENKGNHKRSLLFRINFVYVVAYLLLVGTSSLNIIQVWNPVEVIIGVLIAFYCLVAIIQIMDHVAVVLRICEGKDVTNHKQVKEVLLLFFWPVGIWFLQPRINKLSLSGDL